MTTSKLQRTAFWSCFVLFLLVVEVFSLLDFAHRRAQASREALLLSELTETQIANALSGHDVPAAVQILKQLSREPRLVAACLYGPSGRLVSCYVRPGSRRSFTAPDFHPAGTYRSGDFINTFRRIGLGKVAAGGSSAPSKPVGAGTETLGTLYTRFDAGGFFESWEPLARFLVLLMVLVLALVILLSERVQRAVAGPILELARTALRVASEKQYRNLFDQVPDAVFIIDRESYRFLYANETAMRVYGYSARQLRQMTPIDLHGPDDRRSARPAPHDDRPATRFNAVHRTRDGRKMEIEILSNPIVYEDRPAWLTIARDVTTRNLAQAQLERAKRAAEEASRAKSDFLANMSHEIRTPMNGILGMVDLALETPLTREQREYLTLARSSADSLLSLLNDILDFSKIEAGKLEFEEIAFSLRDDLGEKIKSLGHLASRKGIELVWRVRPDVPDRVVGDPGRLRQILFNLVGNAIKFTGKGEVLVDIWPESVSPHNARLHFLVRDTGIGVAPAQQERIFDAFTQADSSTTRKFGGTGLGLAVVKRLVERMDGRIWVESEVGRGSRFHFTVRLGLPAGVQQPPQPAEPVVLGGLRVLVADDNRETRQVLTEMLKHWRMETEEAGSAVAALEALRRAEADGRRFHLAVIDAQMPAGDEIGRMRELAKRGNSDATRFIFLHSFNGSKSKVDLGAAEGAFLSKPVQQSELLDAILQASTGENGPAAKTPGPEEAQPPAPATGKRVLLAEDNAVNQRLAERLLEKQGCRVTTASDGSQALDLFSRQPFDLILMDVQMPWIDGLEATRSIREKERSTGAHVPIVILTAHAMKGDRERCLAAGADDYLAKPIVPHQLTAMLGRFPSPATAGQSASPVFEPAPAPAFDPNALLERVEGDRALLAEMVRLFGEEARILMEQAWAAIHRNDFPALRRTAHTLKGSIGNFGIGPAFGAARELERAARDRAPATANALRRLENQLKQLTENLEPFRSEMLK